MANVVLKTVINVSFQCEYRRIVGETRGKVLIWNWLRTVCSSLYPADVPLSKTLNPPNKLLPWRVQPVQLCSCTHDPEKGVLLIG